MKFKIFKLRFKSPLHISNVREDYTTSEKMIHSDTLYAAIMQAQSMLGLEVETNPSYTLSSLFPFHADTYFFPKPYFHINTVNTKQDDDSLEPKILKKIEWVDKSWFEKYLSQSEVAQPNGNQVSNNFLTSSEKRGKAKEKGIEVFKGIETPRSLISRTGGDTSIFYLERLMFSDAAGLYFLCLGEDSQLEKLRAALNLLQDEGLGTDRNIGNGQFSWEEGEIDIALPEKANFAVNLSLFNPTSKEELEPMLKEAKYELIKRGGYMTSYNTLKKQDTYMFKEGSIFSLSIEAPISKGMIRDVTPDILREKIFHSILRVGRALFLPVNL